MKATGIRFVLGVFGLAIAAPAMAITSLDLANYQLVGTYSLPAVAASEASAVTYNWSTDTLFVLGDEGDALVEVSKTGVELSVMNLSGFDDTEGVTYVGGNKFVLLEERIQDAYELTYAGGGSASRPSLPTVSLGDTVGNIGLEGISYDPPTGKFMLVKEKTPQRVIEASIDFVGGTGVVSDLFAPALGVSDLSDIQVLSTVPSLAGTPDGDNLLIYSQESSRLLEVSRSGTILSQFDFSGIAGNAEGVTIDSDGVIYIVGEDPALYVLAIPEPATGLLCLGALLVIRRR